MLTLQSLSYCDWKTIHVLFTLHRSVKCFTQMVGSNTTLKLLDSKYKNFLQNHLRCLRSGHLDYLSYYLLLRIEHYLLVNITRVSANKRKPIHNIYRICPTQLMSTDQFNFINSVLEKGATRNCLNNAPSHNIPHEFWQFYFLQLQT